MDDVAACRRPSAALVGRLAPEVLAGLGALARVSRALVGTGSLAELAERALAEMRDGARPRPRRALPARARRAPALERFVAPPRPARDLGRARSCATSPRRGGWRWRAACRSCFREPAGWLGPNPFTPRGARLARAAARRPAATTWSAWSPRPRRRPVALDPVSATVLTLLGEPAQRRHHDRAAAPAPAARGDGAGAPQPRRRRARRPRAGPRASRCASSRCSTSRASTRDGARQPRAPARGGRRRAPHRPLAPRGPARRRRRSAGCARPSRRPSSASSAAGSPSRLTVRGAAPTCGPETVAVVSRVLGEALANVARHAAAGSARSSTVRVEGERLELVVDDDGRGFDPPRAGRPRRRPLRPRDHARARAAARRRLRDRRPTRQAGRASRCACRWPDATSTRALADPGDVEAGRCPHLAMLLASYERGRRRRSRRSTRWARRRNGLAVPPLAPRPRGRRTAPRSPRPASTSPSSRPAGA